MSTRSLIGTLNSDNTARVIYCHWNGYPEVQLPMLIRYYNTPEKVNELLELGDISYLGKWVKPDEGVKHTFKKPADGVTVAYHRDRGEEYEPPFVTVFDRLFREYDGCWIEYFYLFDEPYRLVRQIGRSNVSIQDKTIFLRYKDDSDDGIHYLYIYFLFQLI